MAKKKAGKVIQMLNPVNYIKTKARTLPVYECLVNAGWEKEQLANLVIARRHSNGNITAGLYLVDLTCLGVKDTHFFFNVSETEYHENLELFLSIDEGVEKISYELAHNIVHAGIEFAEIYRFYPHKDFTSITQYILEEDTEAIPLIEIECGIEGLPALFPETFEDKKVLNRIIAHLDKEAGKDSYLLLRLDGRLMESPDDLNDDFDPDNSDFYDEFDDLSLEEKGELFREMYYDLRKRDTDDKSRFFELTESISDDLINDKEYEKHFVMLSNYVSAVTINEDIIPDELLAAQPGELSDETKKRFVDLLSNTLEPKEHKRQFDLFSKEKGLEAAFAFLKFDTASSNRKGEKVVKLFKELAEKHPNYHLVKLRGAKINNIDNHHPLYKPDYFFGNRTDLHPLEFFYYLEFLTIAIVSHTDFNELCAWKEIVYYLPDSFQDKPMIISFITLIQIQIVADYFEVQIE